MKNNIYKLIIVLIIIVIALVFVNFDSINQNKPSEDFIRIHIRANSNSEYDQNLKHKVKEELIFFLTPLLAKSENKKEALSVIEYNLSNIQSKATETIKTSSDADYCAKAKIVKEEFPARAYDDGLVLEKGVYEALIINLGKGKGDNWWCVAFPPLCFVPKNGTNIRYKSKILEIINSTIKTDERREHENQKTIYR